MVETKNETMEKVEQKSLIDEIRNEPVIAPFVDIYETEDNFNLVVNMPGVSKENINLKLEEERLSIIGKRNLDELKNRKYVLSETPFGNYYRTFKISDSIDIEKAKAKFENGQLLVTLPKSEKVKPRTIEIQ